MPRSKQPEATVVDIGAQVTDINNYFFLGVSGSVSVSGYFVDNLNNQVGAAWTISVPQGNGTNNPSNLVVAAAAANSVTYDENITGAIITWAAGNLYFALIPTLSTSDARYVDFKANYAKYPYLVPPPTGNWPIGRVNN